MPETISPPPITKGQTVAPTPAGEYKLSEHTPKPIELRNKDLTSALNRHAGKAQERPSQAPKATETNAELPEVKADVIVKAPVKFTPSDDIDPVVPAAKVDPETQSTDPSAEVIKSAPAQLREAYERLKSDFATRASEGEMTRKQLTEFQAKARSYEDRIKTLEGAEARVKDLEARTLMLDEQLRVTNYLQHHEFHEKFVRPVAEAMQSAAAMVKELMVEGESRLGNEEDLALVLGQPNHTMAANKAAELFGDRMGVAVFEEVKRIKHAQQAQARAVKEAGVKSQEWLKSQQERAANARTTARTEFDRVAEELSTQYPQLYRPPEGDKESVSARQSGEELARLILDGQPEGMPSDKYMKNVAKIYHRAASFPMRELAMQRLQSELDATKTKLAAYEKSTPDGDSRKSAAGVTVDSGGAVVTGSNALSKLMHESLARRAAGRK